MAIQFNIYWSTSPGVTKATGTKIAGVTSPFEHTGLTNGQPYYYVVTAYDADLGIESAESAEVSATPVAQADVTREIIAPRTPIVLVVLSMDFCGRTFGVDPCLATGTKCFNTWPTCKYLTAYLKTTKDYKFTSRAAPGIPFD